jgi:hypothetical protein
MARAGQRFERSERGGPRRRVLRLPAAARTVGAPDGAASLASRLDFTIDDIEDFACGRRGLRDAAAAGVAGADLECTFELTATPSAST